MFSVRIILQCALTVAALDQGCPEAGCASEEVPVEESSLLQGHGYPYESKYGNPDYKTDLELCNATARRKLRAFKTSDTDLMLSTYWDNAWQNYQGTIVRGIDELRDFNEQFFTTVFNKGTGAKVWDASIDTNCPIGKPCSTLYQWKASCQSFVWELNTLSTIWEVRGSGKHRECKIAYELGTNYATCAGNASNPCNAP
eukprot:gb/GFBE01071315.1/.p1 GENE.gb/GFBE01071315.1/~~gb/GFBE01071315.1/.p1  ORF type:complete len:199 (+),score=46.63 gb/GFBE01071315.1/:1-597(+)